MTRLWMLCLWAVRDVMRRPAEGALPASALMMLVFLAATPLILSQAIIERVMNLLENAPSLVVRRVSPMGWQPIAESPAIGAARSVAGLIRPRARLWGTASTPKGPVTVVTRDTMSAEFGQIAGEIVPKPGEAWIGPGVDPEGGGNILILGDMTFTVAGVFSPETSPAAHDLVWLSKSDAHRVLGIPEGFASDLAADVFWEQEVDSVLDELSTAFPWPVRITSRKETIGEYVAAFSLKSGLFLFLMIPSLLAMAFIVTGMIRDRLGVKKEVGLLKSMGWTTGDIVWCQVFRALFIALPATGAGVFLAYGIAVSPAATPVSKLLFGWSTSFPPMGLTPHGAAVICWMVAALVLIPYLAAVLWAAATSAAADPADLL